MTTEYSTDMEREKATEDAARRLHPRRERTIRRLGSALRAGVEAGRRRAPDRAGHGSTGEGVGGVQPAAVDQPECRSDRDRELLERARPADGCHVRPGGRALVSALSQKQQRRGRLSSSLAAASVLSQDPRIARERVTASARSRDPALLGELRRFFL